MKNQTKQSCLFGCADSNYILVRFSLIFLFVSFGFGILFFKGCASSRQPVNKFVSLRKINISDYPAFYDHFDFVGLEHALKQSLLYFCRIPATRIFHFGKDLVTASRMKSSLRKFLIFIKKNPDSYQMEQFIKHNYNVYISIGRGYTSKVIFTGYYEPEFSGSLVKDKEYIYPLYSMPDDLVFINLSRFSDKFANERKLVARVNRKKRVVPYFSRKQINGISDFGKRAHPIVWLKSRVDRFFLEIQGSGKILLKQGGFLRVHYIASNGLRYRSIGRYLIDTGEIAKQNMSMQAIRVWLERHPERIEQILDYNPSFVFFKKETGGPFGCLGVAITPMRSIATDRSLFPAGALCFIETRIPEKTKKYDSENWHKYSGFVLNQDTGGAIKGPGRADFFYGSGDYAEFAAGHMNQPGKLYFLVLKE